MTDILQLPGWDVIPPVRLEGGQYVITANYTTPDTACQKCGVIGRLYRHGTKTLMYRDTPIHGKPSVLAGTVQRYKCRDCGETFVQVPAGVEAARRMTSRCVEYIQEQCLRDTFTRLAEHVGCVEGTIRNIAGGYVEALNAEYEPYLPVWLGMDETELDGSLRCILTDVGSNQPIDLLKDREKRTIVGWLWKFRDRTHVKGLAIDMYKAYKDAARTVFPGLPVVIDKWHVLRYANEAVDTIRIQAQQSLEDRVRMGWKRNRLQLLSRYKNLNEKQRFNLDAWLANVPDLHVAYWLKESFYDIYDAKTKEEAAELLDAWRASVPARMRRAKKDFKPLLTCTANWRDEILAFFDYPITNGYTEALNGVAKVISRNGRGYSFPIMRARLLFKPKRPKHQALKLERGRDPSVRPKLLAKFSNTCQSCGGIYEPEYLYVTRMGPFMEGEPTVNATLLCGTCKVRFHTEGIKRHDSHST